MFASVGVRRGVVVSIVDIMHRVLYSRRIQRLVNVYELAALRRSGIAFAEAPWGSALSSKSSTAMSWNHDYPMLNARAPRRREPIYGLASPTPACSGHHQQGNTSAQVESTKDDAGPRLGRGCGTSSW